MNEKELLEESPARRALTRLLGAAKAAVVPFNPESNPDHIAAVARLEQLKSGVVPDSGRGSSGGTTPLPEGKGWRPHVGARQKLRGLRQTWNLFEKRCKTNTWAAATRERLLDSVVDDPYPEYAAMNIVMGAKIASDAKKAWLVKHPRPADAPPMVAGVEWEDAINHALNEWEARAAATAEAPTEGAAI